MNKLLKINLQLFADGIAPVEAAPAPTEGQPVSPQASAAPEAPLSNGQQLKEIWDKANIPAPAPQPAASELPAAAPVEPPATTPTPEATPTPEQSLPENFKSVGEVVKSFKNAQSELTRKSQMVSDLTKSIDTIKAEYEAKLQALSQPPKTPEPQTQPVDEFAGLDAEGYLEKFYADPAKHDQIVEEKAFKRAEKAFNEKLAQLEGKLNPVVKSHERQQNLNTWNEAVTGFSKENADMPEFLDGMKQYIAENKLQDSKEPDKVLKNAYIYAKGLKYQPLAQVDPKSYLQDEKFMNENIYSNPAIKERFMKEHLTEVRGQQSQLPNSITGQSNSGSPAMPQVSLKGKPMRDVHDAAANMLFGAK